MMMTLIILEVVLNKFNLFCINKYDMNNETELLVVVVYDEYVLHLNMFLYTYVDKYMF